MHLDYSKKKKKNQAILGINKTLSKKINTEWQHDKSGNC
jgi:hypothetical protein